MSNRDRKLVRRRFEVVLAYPAAFLYWDLRGVIAERWCHGPHFIAFGDLGERVVLRSSPSDGGRSGDALLAANVGLRQATFLAEAPDRNRAEVTKLALEFLADCLAVLKPRGLHRILVKEFWSVAAVDFSDAQGWLDETFGLVDLAPSGEWDSVAAGLSFNARRAMAGGLLTSSGTFGLYGKEQASEWFEATLPDLDSSFAVGLGWQHALVSFSNDELELPDPTQAVSDMVSGSTAGLDEVLGRTLRRMKSS